MGGIDLRPVREKLKISAPAISLFESDPVSRAECSRNRTLYLFSRPVFIMCGAVPDHLDAVICESFPDYLFFF